MHPIPKKILLSTACFDSILSGWLTTWWVVVFVKYLSQGSVSTRTILCGVSEILIMLYIVKKMNIPTIKYILIVDAIAYLNLALLWVDITYFYMVGGFMTALVGSVVGSFNSTILAQNIRIPNDRVKFDNLYSLIRTSGMLVGGCIAYFTVLQYVDVKILWVVLYFLYDVDLLVRIVLIRTGWLRYENT